MVRSIQASAIVLGGRRVDAAQLAKAAEAAPIGGLQSLRIPDADEDSLTLALDATVQLLERTGRTSADVGEIRIAGDFPPGGEATFLEALGRPDLPFGRHGTAPADAADMLLTALGAATDASSVVVAASDGRAVGTPLAAAGAVAFWIAPGNGAAAAKEHHVRVAEESASAAWLKDATRTLGAEKALAVYAERSPGESARTLRGHANIHAAPLAKIGDLGPAAPFAALADALATSRGREVAWYVPAVQGGVAVRFTAGKVEAEGLEEAAARPAVDTDAADALRIRSVWQTHGHKVTQGAYVSPQAYLAQSGARYRWVGQRCTACGTLVFPPRESCPHCTDGEMVPHRFSGRGKVYTKTRIARGAAPTEFAPLQEAVGAYTVAVVELDEGPRVAAMCTGPGAHNIDIGDPVRFGLRLLYVQEGERRYGFKARRT